MRLKHALTMRLQLLLTTKINLWLTINVPPSFAQLTESATLRQ
jgi:hypothetical protein